VFQHSWGIVFDWRLQFSVSFEFGISQRSFRIQQCLCYSIFSCYYTRGVWLSNHMFGFNVKDNDFTPPTPFRKRKISCKTIRGYQL
jgi:hypothetical protein